MHPSRRLLRVLPRRDSRLDELRRFKSRDAPLLIASQRYRFKRIEAITSFAETTCASFYERRAAACSTAHISRPSRRPMETEELHSWFSVEVGMGTASGCV